MNVMERKSDGKGEAFISKPAVISWMATSRVDMVGPVDENAFIDLSESPEPEAEE
jgi:hypothetical protein